MKSYLCYFVGIFAILASTSEWIPEIAIMPVGLIGCAIFALGIKIDKKKEGI